MIEIQRYDYDKVWGMEKHELGDYVQYDDHAAIVARLEADLAKANDYINKINTIYQKDEIFVVKNGEGFYTDKFDSVIMTNVVAIKEQGK